MKDELLFRDECFRIVGACLAVHRDKGSGFIEAVYQNATEIELSLSGIPFDRQRNFQLTYRGHPLRHSYTPDLLCFDQIILELKAVKCLTDDHRAQVINYLKASQLRLGILVNFGSPGRLKWERIVLTRP